MRALLHFTWALFLSAGAAASTATFGTTIALRDGLSAASRVTVPLSDSVSISVPDYGPGVLYSWTKNRTRVTGAANAVLTIDRMTADDTGIYICEFSGVLPDGLHPYSQWLVLSTDRLDRLVNFSARAYVGASADQSLISGFVVGAGAPPKKIIIRAVGPSLSIFGVGAALRVPTIRILGATGLPFYGAFPGWSLTYGADLATSLSRSGAFALPAGSRDAIEMMHFPPGSYTVEVVSGDGTPGVVLLEIYEVP